MRYEESVSHILKEGVWKWRVKEWLCKKVGILLTLLGTLSDFFRGAEIVTFANGSDRVHSS